MPFFRQFPPAEVSMRLIKKRIRSKKYTLLRTRGKEGLKRHPFVMPAFGLVLGFFAIALVFISLGGQTIGPSDSRVVSIFIDGQERIVATRAQTVGELTQKLNLDLIEEDIVEPKTDVPITDDDMQVNIYRAKAMTVIDGSTKKATLSAHKSPRLVAVQAGVEVFPEDKAVFTQGNISEGIVGQKVVIDRATPINLMLYGALLPTRTQAQTVAELLKEKSIKLNEGDNIVPAVETPITNSMQVIISRFGQRLIVQEEVIPAPVEYIADSNLPAGSRVVREPGSPGKKVVTYQIQLENDKEIGRTVIQEIILTQPIKEIQAKGTKPVFADYNAEGIPARVFCGSPKQRNWKNINVGNAAIGRALAAERGWAGGEWDALLELFACEASWNALAGNPFSGAYGIPQALPGGKMALAGSDWQYNPRTQIIWGLGYISGRYGTPSSALSKHYSSNWY